MRKPQSKKPERRVSIKRNLKIDNASLGAHALSVLENLSAASKPAAVGYVRVSLVKQADKGGSLAVQRDRIVEHAVFNGLNLVRVYEDATSGAKGDDKRPGLHAALDAILTGAASTLIVADADRLARDSDEAGYIRTVVKRARAKVVVLSEVNESVEKKAVNQLLAVLEREKIRARMRTWAAARKAKGLPLGRTPYGATADERKTIARFKSLRAEGLSLRAATERLNAEGFRGRTGKPWHMQSLARIAG